MDELLAARRASAPGDEAVPGPAKVSVDNHLSDTHTVVEVKCPDRVGLLYLITRTLAAFDLSIASARIATDIDHAFDTFYVADRHGRRIEDPERDDPRARWRSKKRSASRSRCSATTRPRCTAFFDPVARLLLRARVASRIT